MIKKNEVWMLRAKQHGNNRISEFLEDNIIAIGWPQIGNLSKLGKEEIRKEIISNEYYRNKYDTKRKLSMAVSQVQRFVIEMNIGDYVIVPDLEDIYIGIIASDYMYVENLDNDIEGYPHQRKVEFKLHLTRDNLDQNLRDSLRATMTLANLSDHRNIVKDLVEKVDLIDSSVEESGEQDVFELKYPLEDGGSAYINIPRTINKNELENIINIISKL